VRPWTFATEGIVGVILTGRVGSASEKDFLEPSTALSCQLTLVAVSY
jgi:hypothetical protein